MSEEFENKSEEVQAGNNSQENSREGYRPVSGNTGYRTGRSPRPRIHAQRAYVPRRTGDDQEGGFRPEGFGAGLQQEEGQRSYRPRTNYNAQGGYQSRNNNYRQRPQSGYRPRYNNDEEGGYQPRSNYQSRPQNNYRPRYNNDEETQTRPRY